nr:uncharacterized protein LOC107376299 [Nothobranchius furzeri]
MGKACGLGLGLLLIVLVQAEHVWCSLPNEAQRFQHGNTYAGLQRLDEEPRKFSNPQNKVRRILVSPNLLKNHFSNVGPSVKQGSSKGLSTSSYLEVLSQPAQGSARLVKSHLVPRTSGRRPASLRANAQAEPKHLGRKRAWADVRGSPRSYSTSLSTSRERYSSPASLSAAEKPTKFSEMGSPAFLFGPVAPGSRGSVKMQTYARGPAKRVYSNSASPGRRAGSSFLRNVAPNQGSEARSWLHASAPGRTSLGLAVPRSVRMGVPQDSATVYEIPSQYGGFAIRRVKEPDNQKQAEGQMLQQISKPAPQLMVAYPNFPNGHLETKWSRLTQHKL